MDSKTLFGLKALRILCEERVEVRHFEKETLFSLLCGFYKMYMHLRREFRF